MKFMLSQSTVGPRRSVLDMQELLSEAKITVPREYLVYLSEIGNGGAPEKAMFVTVPLETVGEARLHGIYGVNHPNASYSLIVCQQYDVASDRPDLVSFGFDEGGDIFAFRSQGERIDVIWIERGTGPDAEWAVVADSFESFVEALHEGI